MLEGKIDSRDKPQIKGVGTIALTENYNRIMYTAFLAAADPENRRRQSVPLLAPRLFSSLLGWSPFPLWAGST
jgi:hypothetical protein